MVSYYAFPLDMDALMRGEHLDQVDVKRSIQQNIQLLLKTLPLRYRFDPIFGSILNKQHFATPPQRKGERRWRENLREKIQKNLKQLLALHEQRLVVDDVLVRIEEIQENANRPVVIVRIEIKGYLKSGRKEIFHYPDSQLEEDAQNIFPLLIPVGLK